VLLGPGVEKLLGPFGFTYRDSGDAAEVAHNIDEAYQKSLPAHQKRRNSDASVRERWDECMRQRGLGINNLQAAQFDPDCFQSEVDFYQEWIRRSKEFLERYRGCGHSGPKDIQCSEKVGAEYYPYEQARLDAIRRWTANELEIYGGVLEGGLVSQVGFHFAHDVLGWSSEESAAFGGFFSTLANLGGAYTSRWASLRTPPSNPPQQKTPITEMVGKQDPMPQPDPVSPTTVSPTRAPDPANVALPPDVAGSKSQDFWANTEVNQTGKQLKPGDRSVTDISAVRKPPPATTPTTLPVSNESQQRANAQAVTGGSGGGTDERAAMRAKKPRALEGAKAQDAQAAEPVTTATADKTTTAAQTGAEAKPAEVPADDLAAMRAKRQQQAIEDAKALEIQAAQSKIGRVHAATGGSGGGRVVTTTTSPLTPAFKPHTPNTPASVTRTLQADGLTDSEIASLASKGAKKLGPVSAGRVIRLGEHFTPEDLKELGATLEKTGGILTDEVVDDLLASVPPGGMKDMENSLREAAREQALRSGPEEDVDTSGTGARVDRPRPPKQKDARAADELPGQKKLDPGHVMAEKQALPAIEAQWEPGWEYHRVARAPGAKPNETLGSTVPEYYHPKLNIAVEVKRWNLEGLNIGKDGKILGTPSEGSILAIEDANAQLAMRQHNLPGTQQVAIFNVSGFGVKDIETVGAEIRNLIEAHGIRYDRVFLQNGTTLTEIQ
jgi:hypothetical protein